MLGKYFVLSPLLLFLTLPLSSLAMKDLYNTPIDFSNTALQLKRESERIYSTIDTATFHCKGNNTEQMKAALAAIPLKDDLYKLRTSSSLLGITWETDNAEIVKLLWKEYGLRFGYFCVPSGTVHLDSAIIPDHEMRRAVMHNSRNVMSFYIQELKSVQILNRFYRMAIAKRKTELIDWLCKQGATLPENDTDFSRGADTDKEIADEVQAVKEMRAALERESKDASASQSSDGDEKQNETAKAIVDVPENATANNTRIEHRIAAVLSHLGIISTK